MTRSYSDKFAIAAARHSSAARRGIFDTDIFLTAFVNAVFCFYAGGQSTEYCGRKPDALCQYMATLPISWDMINAQASTLTVGDPKPHIQTAWRDERYLFIDICSF